MMAPPRATTCKLCGAPRYELAKGARCETHWHELQAEERRRSKARGVPSGLPDYQRIRDYVAEAVRQGATEDESWWCAMAAEIRFKQHGRSSRWLTPFIASELAWLRANSKVLNDLDARQWAAVRERETVTIDDGWTDEEVA